MRAAFVILALLISLLAFVVGFSSVQEQRIELYRDSSVTVGEIRRPIDRYLVHVSPTRYLSVKGKTYLGLRGLEPYYLRVPELQSILFVSERPRGKVHFHVVNLRTGGAISIDGEGSGFGRALSTNRSSLDRRVDSIQSVSSNQLVLTTGSPDWQESLTLNLSSKAVEQRRIEYFDPQGRLTNRIVQTNFDHQ